MNGRTDTFRNDINEISVGFHLEEAEASCYSSSVMGADDKMIATVLFFSKKGGTYDLMMRLLSTWPHGKILCLKMWL